MSAALDAPSHPRPDLVDNTLTTPGSPASGSTELPRRVMSDTISIHALIATHGRSDLLERTLQSLAAAHRPASLRAIWIVENGTDAGPRGLCERYRDPLAGLLRYVHLPQPGKAKALQHALGLIGSGFVLFLDDDIRVEPGLFELYERAFAARGPDALYGGPLAIDYELPPPAWLIPHLPASARGWSWDPPTPGAPVTEPLFLGANYASSVAAINRVGGFNPELGTGSTGNPVGEETDIQRRLLAAGLPGVYVPGATVWHYVPRQRCTPQWTLERARRAWMTNGLLDAKPHEGPRWRGVPRWMWRRALSLGARAALMRFHSDPAQRFDARKKYHEWRGFMEGVRQRSGQ